MDRPPAAGGPHAPAPGPADARAGMPAADRVIDALRVYAADSAAVNHHLARWLGVNTADAEAFGEIVYAQDRGTPLTPTALSRRLGLSSGATATLLNRLEAAGLLLRSREHRDRRVVTLRITPAVKEQAVHFFEPLAVRVDQMMREHPEPVLHMVVAMLDQLHVAISEVVESLEAPATPRPALPDR